MSWRKTTQANEPSSSMSMSGESAEPARQRQVLRDDREVHAGDAAARRRASSRPARARPRSRRRSPRPRPRRAGAASPVPASRAGSTSSGGAIARPTCASCRRAGGDVAALLPDRVRGAVDAEVDVEVAGRPDRRAGRSAARTPPGVSPPGDDRGVDVAVGDPGDREPVAVARGDLDLGRRAGRRSRRAPARRHAPAEHAHDVRVRDAAVVAEVGDGAGAVAREVDVADRQHVGVRAVQRGGGQPARVRGRGRNEREGGDQRDDETAWQSGSRSRGSDGSNRPKAAAKVPGGPYGAGRMPSATSLLAEGRNLPRAARLVPPQLGPHHAPRRARRRPPPSSGRAAVSPSRVRRSSTSPTVRACSRRAA